MRQDNQDERCYGIEELAELGGVTRRTVRYYVQRGLLPTPLGTGRGPHYTAAHLERLMHIRTLQETGVPLAEIAARLDGVPQTLASATAALPERSPSVAPAKSIGIPKPPAASCSDRRLPMYFRRCSAKSGCAAANSSGLGRSPASSRRNWHVSLRRHD